MMDTFSSYYENARKEIAPLVPSHIKSVLEIGCGAGGTLLWLKQEYGMEICDGIEFNKRAIAIARQKGLNVVEVDIEKNLSPLGRCYDAVLCLDVLEHLADPWSILEKLKTFINPGGYLIVSIPNIAHISILSGLILRDQWHYEDSGILDRTHLRFFTKRTACDLLTNSGFEVVTQLPRFGRKTHRRLNFITFRLFERFFTYQNLFLARKL